MDFEGDWQNFSPKGSNNWQKPLQKVFMGGVGKCFSLLHMKEGEKDGKKSTENKSNGNCDRYYASRKHYGHEYCSRHI